MRAFAIAFLLWCSATPGASAAEPNPTAVFELLAERLSVMKSVAAYKRDHDLPVEDKPREAIVLDKAAEAAARAGLDPVLIRPFFLANIEAAKSVQHCWLERWHTGESPMPTERLDLVNDIRPRLIDIGGRLNQAIANYISAGGVFGPQEKVLYQQDVRIDCLAPTNQEALFDALAQVRHAKD